MQTSGQTDPVKNIWMHAGMRHLANSRPELRHTIMRFGDGEGEADPNANQWAGTVQGVVCTMANRAYLVRG
jgi:hypothetical protein